MNRLRQRYQRLVLPSVLLSACLHLLMAFAPESFGRFVFGLSRNATPLPRRMEVVLLAPEPAPRYVESNPVAGRIDVVSPPPPAVRSRAQEGDSLLALPIPGLDSPLPPEIDLFPESSVSSVSRAADSIQVLDSYLAVVFERLALAKSYPETARRMGQQGEVSLAFTISRNGNLEGEIELSEPCRFGVLNRSAVDCVKRGAPFPPLPEYVLTEYLCLTVRISFDLEP